MIPKNFSLSSDYQQWDEQWWLHAKRSGVYFQSEYDESAGVYSTDIALRINDNIGSFLGVIKAVTNVDETFKSFEFTNEILSKLE